MWNECGPTFCVNVVRFFSKIFNLKISPKMWLNKDNSVANKQSTYRDGLISVHCEADGVLVFVKKSFQVQLCNKKQIFILDLVFHLNFFLLCWIRQNKMAHQIAPSVNCSLDEIDLNALKVNLLFIYKISVKKDLWFGSKRFDTATVLPTV